MSAIELNDDQKKLWMQVLHMFNFPSIPEPELVGELEGGAHYDFKNRKIRISLEDMTELERSLSPEDTFLAINTHEVRHYMNFPANLATWMYMAHEAKRMCGKGHVSLVNIVNQTFADIVVDSKSVRHPRTKEFTLRMRQADLEYMDEKTKANLKKQIEELGQSIDDDTLDTKVEEMTRFDKVLRGTILEYLHYQADEEFTFIPPEPYTREDIEQYLADMKKIQFTASEIVDSRISAHNLSNHRTNLAKYILILKDMYKKLPKSDQEAGGSAGSGGGVGFGGGVGSGGKTSEGNGSGGDTGSESDTSGSMDKTEDFLKGLPVGDTGSEGSTNGSMDKTDDFLKSLPIGDLKKALQQLIRPMDKEDYKKLVEELEEMIGQPLEAKDSKKYRAVGIGEGSKNGSIELSTEHVPYYIDLARQYPLHIVTKQMYTVKPDKHTEGMTEFKIGDNPVHMLPAFTGGKFIPGLTPKMQTKEHREIAEDQDIPDALIAIDSSGSTVNPGKVKSDSVLAAMCVALSYNLQGSKIGVINFSDTTFYLPYTHDLYEAASGIVAWQGGGTVINVDKLREIASKSGMFDHMMMDRVVRNPESLDSHIRKQVEEKNISLDEAILLDSIENSRPVDVFMFTDGGIYNLAQVVNYFEETVDVNRATIVLADYWDQSVEEYGDKIRVRKIDKGEDIASITTDLILDNMKYSQR